MEEVTRPRRRRFQFSLGTLFVVVTVLSVLTGYQVNWIQQRRDAAAKKWRVTREDPMGGPNIPRAPGLLWLFGEQGYSHVAVWLPDRKDSQLTAAEEAEIASAGKLFPEAGVSWAYTVRESH